MIHLTALDHFLNLKTHRTVLGADMARDAFIDIRSKQQRSPLEPVTNGSADDHKRQFFYFSLA